MRPIRGRRWQHCSPRGGFMLRKILALALVLADFVAKAAPDGYTLMVYSPGFVVNKFMHKSLPYDTEKDFVPVTNLVSSGGLFLALNPAIPAETLKEFIAYASKPQAKPAYSTP